MNKLCLLTMVGNVDLKDRNINEKEAGDGRLKCIRYEVVFFKKWANPGLFFVYFRNFQTNIKNFKTKICQKMSIQYTVPGFEPRPSERESLPITTRPGLPPRYEVVSHVK